MVKTKNQMYVLKNYQRKKFSKIFIKVNNQTINFDIQDLNVANVLAAISVLNELKVDLIKSKSNLKILDHLKVEVKILNF